jgi:hypothetical protein
MWTREGAREFTSPLPTFLRVQALADIRLDADSGLKSDIAYVLPIGKDQNRRHIAGICNVFK